MRVRALFMAALASAVPAAALAQAPAGGEFRVNTYTTFAQYGRLAVGSSGDFVAVWQSDQQDGSGFGVYAQRYDAAGAPRGAEFPVSTVTIGNQWFPAVAMQRSGFVVAWTSGTGFDIFARRFDASGAAQGAEFRVNTYTTNGQLLPALAADAAGNFVVVWQSTGPEGGYGGYGIVAQRYDALGAPRGGEFQVNTYTAGSQFFPAVASGAAGNFAVVWTSYDQDGPGRGVFGQVFSAAGAPMGSEFRVNTYTTDNQSAPAVAADAGGNFVVTWHTYAEQDGNRRGVFAQRYSPTGIPRGGEFRVNGYTTYDQGSPGVASDGVGNFVVTWQSWHQDGTEYGIFGQRFDAAGVRRGAEFRVNTYTNSTQLLPAVAAESSGNFAVMWASAGQDGGGLGAFAQRFGGLRPAALAVDTAAGPGSNGNGLLEPGESVDLRPSWRNVNGAGQTFGGTLSGLVGPAGATYTITDGSGGYGTVADNATAPCINCYGVSLSNPPTRPLTHWDASALELITPDTQGQRKRWALHVGNSFTDVSTSSPYYRFIETLLHRAVTGGCSPTEYCPASSTARNQMAVFVLVAKEGAGYVPPVCGSTPMFGDVPPSDVFCRWIEELARRGVVSGCGGGNYCPADPVSREQMAVFVLRTLDPALTPPACSAPTLFTDVPETSPFCRWIEELARRGVVTGCGGGNYCPAQAVTREQMGVFISVTFALSLYGP